MCVYGFAKPVFLSLLPSTFCIFLILFSCFIKEKKKSLKKQNFQNEGNITKKAEGKDQLEHMTKKDPALKASEEGESRDRGEEKEKGKVSLSQTYGLNVRAFINSQGVQKDLSIYNAFKSHRGKRK